LVPGWCLLRVRLRLLLSGGRLRAIVNRHDHAAFDLALLARRWLGILVLALLGLGSTLPKRKSPKE